MALTALSLALTPWFIVVISVCILCVLIIFVFYCVCWESPEADVQQFYIIDEDGLKRTAYSPQLKSKHSIFNQFTASDLPLKENSIFFDSTESLLNNNFENVVLEIENDDKSSVSCKSATSRNTFYSVWSAITRTFSFVDSAAANKSDIENLIE